MEIGLQEYANIRVAVLESALSAGGLGVLGRTGEMDYLIASCGANCLESD